MGTATLYTETKECQTQEDHRKVQFKLARGDQPEVRSGAGKTAKMIVTYQFSVGLTERSTVVRINQFNTNPTIP
jgi:NAD(P)H-dependent flavin oxidoreductase YrpB (nitropropane dioxygenase family)